MGSKTLPELEADDEPSDSPQDAGSGIPPDVVQALGKDRRGHAQEAGPFQRTARVRHKSATVMRSTCTDEMHSDVGLQVVEVAQHQFISLMHTVMIIGYLHHVVLRPAVVGRHEVSGHAVELGGDVVLRRLARRFLVGRCDDHSARHAQLARHRVAGERLPWPLQCAPEGAVAVAVARHDEGRAAMRLPTGTLNEGHHKRSTEPSWTCLLGINWSRHFGVINQAGPNGAIVCEATRTERSAAEADALRHEDEKMRSADKGKSLSGSKRARQKRNAATTRRPPEQRMKEASAKTAGSADADQMRYHTRANGRLSEQEYDLPGDRDRQILQISLGDDVPTEGPFRAPCGSGMQRCATYRIVRQLGGVRGLRLTGGNGVAFTTGEPVAFFWAATASTPTAATDIIRLGKTEFRYDKRKSTAYLANTVLPEQRNGSLNNNTRVSNKVVAHSKGNYVALLATRTIPWNASIFATYNDRAHYGAIRAQRQQATERAMEARKRVAKRIAAAARSSADRRAAKEKAAALARDTHRRYAQAQPPAPKRKRIEPTRSSLRLAIKDLH